MHDVYPLLEKTDFPRIFRGRLNTIQINLGYKCNQSCLHCHVNAGPKRKEMMTLETIDQILSFIKKSDVKNIDLTGGAPELNDHFDYLVTQARALDCHIIDRCNLTVLQEPDKEYLFEFFRKNYIEVVASLPCYEEDNVNRQRGDGVFKKSIEVLQRLNEFGYGINKKLQLNLVYNPQDAVLPPEQNVLEKKYKSILMKNYNITFNNLYTITNMPIARFGSTLISQKKFGHYIKLLKGNFNDDALNKLMCKSLISIDYRGYVYDCDFNQMLGLNINGNKRLHISDVKNTTMPKKINTADHCFGCTAGSGSSCGGILV
jgi:radical SAM/Cys-rich protein